MSKYKAAEVNYSTAISACKLLGAQLATISNEEEDRLVDSLIGDSMMHWIGLNDIEEEGTFVWQDGATSHPT